MAEISTPPIKGYQLLELIGEGAYGAVYLAHQPVIDREVAIKIILPEYACQPDFIRRFESEAQLVAQLEHIHIVPLYDYWRNPEGAYLVMRLMRGGSLEELIQAGPLPLAQVARVLEQVASALAAAHRRGIVHRDLKPANILLDEEGNTYLSDFGIAKALDEGVGQTMTGAIIGTPAYITPEQVQSMPVSPQTDIYALGVVMYTMLTGQHPFPEKSPGDLIARHLRDPLSRLTEVKPNLPPGLDAVIQCATAKDPLERYPNVEDFLAEFWVAIGPEMAPTIAGRWGEDLLAVYNPYKGLRAFHEADAEDFFGRESLTGKLLARLAGMDQNRFLAVVGPSGSGKSSVVKAGLIPALRGGGLPGSDKWFITEMVPGTHPLEELELALLRVAVEQPPSLLEQLEKDQRGLIRAVRRILPGDDDQLLLVIDQFEELFSLVEKEEKVNFFLDSLYTAVTDPASHLKVVITLRADFYDRPLNHPNFGGLVQEGTEVILPLNTEDLQDAIRCPTERVGVSFEEGLVTDIVADVVDQPGELPLLQYALTELFERRDGRILKKDAYQKIGGVLGALGRRSEEVFTGLDEGGQEAARQLFLRLVTLGEGVEDTRRRVLRSEVETVYPKRFTEVIDSFGKVRLLTFDHDPVTRGPTVEVAHEALLLEWRRLREWLDESRADIRLQRVLENAANEWFDSGQDASFLLRGTRLGQFEAWAASTDIALNRGEEQYLENSLAGRREREAAEAERLAREAATEHRSQRFLRGLVVVMGLALVMAVILISYALYANSQAKKHQVIAEEHADLAFSRELTEAAFGVLETDPELSALLALQALSQADTPAAQSALHQAVPALHLVDTLVGHEDLIQGLAVSPDGQLLATASQDGTVKLWNLDTGVLLKTLEFSGASDQLEGKPPVAVDFSPDGRFMATGGFDQEVNIWELESDPSRKSVTVNLVSTLVGNTGAVNAIQFSPDGSLVASAGGDSRGIIWDLESGNKVNDLMGHLIVDPSRYEGGKGQSRMNKPFFSLFNYGLTSSLKFLYLSGVTGISFSNRGDQIISSGVDGIATVWDTHSAEDIYQLGTYVRRSATVNTFQSYGKWRSQNMDFDELLEILYIRKAHHGAILDIDLSPDGDHLATASEDGLVKIWELSARLTPALIINQDAFSIAYSPDGDYLAVGSMEGVIGIFDVKDGRELVTLLGHAGAIYDMAFTPQGYLISGGEDKIVKIWDPNPSEELFHLMNPYPIWSTAVSPDSKFIATGLDNSSVILRDRLTGQPLYPPVVSQNVIVTAVAFSPDERFLVTSNMDVWDAESGHLVCRLVGHSDNVTGIAFSSRGTLLASASYDKTIKIWDIQDCDVYSTPIADLAGHEDRVVDVDFISDGSVVASIGWDRTIRIWDWQAENTIAKWGINEMPTSIGISPDGNRLAVGDQEGNLTIWDITTENPWVDFTLSGHTGFVFDLDFSPDGNLVATASSDGEVKVWDVTNGEELLSLFGHHGVATGVEFSPDGTWLISSGTDGVIRGYTLDVELLKEIAKAKLTRSLTETECQKYLHVDQCSEYHQ